EVVGVGEDLLAEAAPALLYGADHLIAHADLEGPRPPEGAEDLRDDLAALRLDVVDAPDPAPALLDLPDQRARRRPHLELVEEEAKGAMQRQQHLPDAQLADVHLEGPHRPEDEALEQRQHAGPLLTHPQRRRA